MVSSEKQSLTDPPLISSSPSHKEEKTRKREGSAEGIGSKRAKGGARVHPVYSDRHEEYALVTKDDLREFKAFSWMQESLLGCGVFFFSGAFWLLCELLAHQAETSKFELTPWMFVCFVSMSFGIILTALAFGMFVLKQKRLKKYDYDND